MMSAQVTLWGRFSNKVMDKGELFSTYGRRSQFAWLIDMLPNQSPPPFLASSRIWINSKKYKCFLVSDGTELNVYPHLGEGALHP